MMKATNLYLDHDDTLYTFRFVFLTTDGKTSVVRDISQQFDLECADEEDVARALRLLADRVHPENIEDEFDQAAKEIEFSGQSIDVAEYLRAKFDPKDRL